MRVTVFVVLLQIAVAFQIPTGTKLQVLRKFHDYVTDFLTPEQVSKAIDVAAVSIHRGKTTEDVIDDLEAFLAVRLTEQQMRRVTQARDALREQLSAQESEVVLKRTRHVVAYSMTPAVEKVRENSQTPETAYQSMNSLLTPEYVASVKQLIKMSLSEREFAALSSSMRGIIQLD